MQRSFLPLIRVFLFAVPPVAPFVGASDVGQGYTGPKTGNQGQGIKPWTHKKIVLHGQGFEPWTHKKKSRARPGVRTLDRPKRSFLRLFTQSLNAIMHTIVKFHVGTKYAQMHKWVPRGTCPLDNGQWPDRPKNGQRTDRFKNDKSFKKDMFPAEHIFFKVWREPSIYISFQ